MKKILLLFSLMMVSLGHSQTFPLDFSDSADLPTGFDGVSTSIVQDGGQPVLKIIGGTNTWDNSQLVLAQNINLSDNSNNTITFKFKSIGAATSGQHLLKFEGGVGGAAVAEGFFTASGNDWQTITIDFGAGLGNYSKMVIFTDSGASSNGYYNDATGTYLIDDIAGGTNVAPPVVIAPTVAATNPANSSSDVISIFSGSYTNLANTNFYPNWSQTTQYDQVNIAGNPTLKYSSLNYQGITFESPFNASTMTSLHLDLWTADCATFDVYVLDGSGDEQKVTVTPTLNGWNSINIDLSQYTRLNKTNTKEFKIVGSGTVFLDNIYFWKLPAGTNSYYADADHDGYGAGSVFLSTATTAPTGYSVNNTDCNDTNAAVNPGATEIADGVDNNCNGTIDEGFPPSIAAPTPPARNAWDVKSIFSNAYSNATLNELPTSWSELSETLSVETIASNPTWKFKGEFLGIVTNYASGVDLSQMTTMHIDYWTPDNNRIDVKLVNTVDGGDSFTALETPVVTGTWRSIDVPLTAFGALNKSKITQLLIDPAGVSTVYVDNFYFYRAATSAPTATLQAFTVPTKVVGSANFNLTAPGSNSTGTFSYTSSNEGVATISGSTVTIKGAGSTIITATQAAAGGFGVTSTTATLVVSIATAAPTPPTIPTDRVVSIFSDSFSNVGGTQFRPNWGQTTQYDLVNVAENPTLKYSNLNYEGVQLESPINVTTYSTLHIDVYGAGASAVDFYVINQAGPAGSGISQIEQNTPLTLVPGRWNSFDVQLSSLNTLDLTRVGQFKFEGTGTIYVDNIYFTKPVPSHTTAPTVANVSYCKGAVASTLTATATGSNVLKWYSTATIATALAAAPKPLTTTSKTTSYYVAQVMSDGFVSPRAKLDVTVTTDVVPTASASITGTAAQGALVGTNTTATYTAAVVAGAASYSWSVPTGMNIVDGQGTATVTVNFSNVPAGIGAIGNLSVVAINAAGCSGLAKTLALTKILPVAPAAIVMNDLSLPLPVSGIPTAITSFAKYMGTTTVVRLTATPSATATSYQWDLPTGVNQLSGGTTNVITVNFAGVTNANTHNYNTTAATPVSTNVLRIGVKAVNGVGVSITPNTALVNPTTTSTAKLLTLTAVAPAAPVLKMLDMAVSSTVAVTDISKYIGTNKPLTLVGTVAAATLASSFSWELPEGVNVVPGSVLTSNSIVVNFEDVNPGTASLYIGIKAVNGMGSSVKNNATALPATSSTATLLKLTAGLPVAAGAVVGSVAICSNQASSVTYTITAAAVKTNIYVITAPNGTTIVGGSGNTKTILAVDGATFTVNYPNGFTSVKPAQKTITIQSVNGFGLSATNKVLTLTSNACTTTARIAKAPATDFKVIAYPNPSSAVFYLAIESASTSATTIQVYDMQGRMIENKKVNANAVELGANYTSGIYNVILENAGQAKTIRLIKK